MSELQKKWAKTKITNAMHAMPPPPLPEFSELDEDRYASGSGSIPNTPQDDDSSSASSMSSTGTVIPSPGRALFARPQGFPGRSLEPIPWTTYFERELFLPAADGSITYHAYLNSPAPSAGPGKPSGPLFVTHHGAGSSGLSFAVLSSEIRKRLPTAGVLSLDARGHGLTTTITSTTTNSESGASAAATAADDLTLPTLASDLAAVITLTQAAMHWPSLPPILLVGHSLGGAVVTELAFSLAAAGKNTIASTAPSTTATTSLAARPAAPAVPSTASNLPINSTPTLPTTTTTTPPDPPASLATLASSGQLDLLGYAVLDVVEGSALDALQSMHAYLATRPAGFDSLRDAVDWHVRSRTVRNAVSARASVPGLLVHVSSPSLSVLEEEGVEGREAGEERDGGGGGGGESVVSEAGGYGEDEVDEDGDDGYEPEESVNRLSRVNGARKKSTAGNARGGKKPWQWRTDLAKTQPFWEGWFNGLSKKFLSGKGGKMLLLAGTDRLDTELTIGQMQGKYALQVFPEAGHFIHEDLPEKTAIALVDFHRRNDRSALVLPPKVSELLAQGKRV